LSHRDGQSAEIGVQHQSGLPPAQLQDRAFFVGQDNSAHAACSAPCYAAQMRSSIWIGIFIGSTIGGLIPELWGGDMLSYSGVLLSGVGAFAGLWLGSRGASR
jgi:predicted MFS family arabinose efflux permease